MVVVMEIYPRTRLRSAQACRSSTSMFRHGGQQRWPVQDDWYETSAAIALVPATDETVTSASRQCQARTRAYPSLPGTTIASVHVYPALCRPGSGFPLGRDGDRLIPLYEDQLVSDSRTILWVCHQTHDHDRVAFGQHVRVCRLRKSPPPFSTRIALRCAERQSDRLVCVAQDNVTLRDYLT